MFVQKSNKIFASDIFKLVASQFVILLSFIVAEAIIYYGADKWAYAGLLGFLMNLLTVGIVLFMVLKKDTGQISEKYHKGEEDTKKNVKGKEEVFINKRQKENTVSLCNSDKNVEMNFEVFQRQTMELLSMCNQFMEVKSSISDMVEEWKYQRQIREDGYGFHYTEITAAYSKLKYELQQERKINEKLMLENNELRKMV